MPMEPMLVILYSSWYLGCDLLYRTSLCKKNSAIFCNMVIVLQ